MCSGGSGGTGRMIDIPPRPAREFNWGGGGPGSITGRGRLTATRRLHTVCIISGGDNGHPHANTRAHYERQVRIGNRRGWLKLDRVVGHMFAAVLRGEATLADWWAYETDLSAHQPDCRYRRLCERLRPPERVRARTARKTLSGQHSHVSGAVAAHA